MLKSLPLPRVHQVAFWHARPLTRGALLGALWLLALPLLWLSLLAAPAVRVEVGEWGDHTALAGVNGIEAATSENYRWTTSRAELAVPNLSAHYQLLRMRAHGWRPEGLPSPVVRLETGGRSLGALQTTPQLRVYAVLLPRDALGAETRVVFASDAYNPPGDPREIGFVLDWVELRALGGQAVPAPLQFGGQALLLALCFLLVWLLGLTKWPTLAIALVLALAGLGANLWQPLWVSQGLIPWLLLVAGLLLATWLVRPLLMRWLAGWMSLRQSCVAWALLVALFGLRLLGAAHPWFDARDMPVHTRWLGIVATGELYLYSTPAELQNRKTFNPPAGYLLLLPLRLLLPEHRMAVQVGTALLDALGCALLLPLARELRLRPRAALLGLALSGALPIAMTMMWWGFAANAIAQSLWLLLLWLLLRLTRAPTPRGVVLATVVAALCLTTHVGALVLLIATLALVALLGWRALPRRSWSALVLVGGLALLLMLPVYFTAAAAALASEARSPASLDLAVSFAKGVERSEERLGLVWRALTLGWLPPILVLAPLGFGLLWTARERHPLGRVLLAASLVVCIVFFGTYLFLGLLTRYIYFVTPLVCLAAGVILARLWARPGGRWSVTALLLWVWWSGAALWLAGVLLRVKPSLVPLTH
jgi:toxin CptA